MSPNQNSIHCAGTFVKVGGNGFTEFRRNLKSLCMICWVTEKELAVSINCVNNLPHLIQHHSVQKSILHHQVIQRSACKTTKCTCQPKTGADVSIWNGWRQVSCLLFVFFLSSSNFLTRSQHVIFWPGASCEAPKTIHTRFDRRKGNMYHQDICRCLQRSVGFIVLVIYPCDLRSDKNLVMLALLLLFSCRVLLVGPQWPH